MSSFRSDLLRILPIADPILMPFVYPAGWLLKNIRKAGVERFPLCRNALLQVGVFPIRNHYYEPQFDHRNTKVEFSEDRNLPGIDWNVAGQIEFLHKLVYAPELTEIPSQGNGRLEFHFDNSTFGPGDAEYWYQLIRALKPRRIFEIGGGYSTLMAVKALEKNRAEDAAYHCEHICIEPYEMPWLERAGVKTVRKRVEDLNLQFFSALGDQDVLFIDSSHVIRPEGDVLFEYLEILPTLNKGVIVHIHDIFSPKNYLKAWLREEVCFWNEQYLLEAFLTNNGAWRTIGALNYLHHNYFDLLRSVAPYLTPKREPGSFYIQKIG